MAEAIAADGTSRALGAGPRVTPSPRLLERLRDAAGELACAGTIVSTDLFYDGREGAEQGWLADGALAVEMEAATLFALARRRGLEAAALLLVTDLLFPARTRIDPESLREGEQRLGELALRALAQLS